MVEGIQKIEQNHFDRTGTGSERVTFFQQHFVIRAPLPACAKFRVEQKKLGRSSKSKYHSVLVFVFF